MSLYRVKKHLRVYLFKKQSFLQTLVEEHISNLYSDREMSFWTSIKIKEIKDRDKFPHSVTSNLL